MTKSGLNIHISDGKRTLVQIDDFTFANNKITFLFGESGIGKSIISKFDEINGVGFIERTDQIASKIEAMTETFSRVHTDLEKASKKNLLALLALSALIGAILVLQILQMFFMQ